MPNPVNPEEQLGIKPSAAVQSGGSGGAENGDPSFLAEAPGQVLRGAQEAINEAGETATQIGNAVERLFPAGGFRFSAEKGVQYLNPREFEESQQAGEQWGGEVFDESLMPAEPETAGGEMVNDLSQFVTSVLGAGRALRGLGVLQGGGVGTIAAREGTKEVAANAFGMDFSDLDANLSNLIESFPALGNPITEALAVDEDDGEVTRKLKNTLEGLGMGGAIGSVFLSIRALRAARAGDADTLAESIDDLERLNPEAASRVADDVPGRPAAAPWGPRPVADEVSAAEAIEGQRVGLTKAETAEEAAATAGRADEVGEEGATRAQGATEEADEASPGSSTRATDEGAEGAPEAPQASASAATPERATYANLGDDPSPAATRYAEALENMDAQRAAPASPNGSAASAAGAGRRAAPSETDELVTQTADNARRAYLQGPTRGLSDIKPMTAKAAGEMNEAVFKRMTDAVIQASEQSGRVLTDGAVQAAARANLSTLADAAGKNGKGVYKSYVAKFGQDMKGLAAHVESAYSVIEAAEAGVRAKAAKIGRGELTEWGGDLDAAKIDLAEHASAVDEMMSGFLDGRADIGRAFRALNRAGRASEGQIIDGIKLSDDRAKGAIERANSIIAASQAMADHGGNSAGMIKAMAKAGREQVSTVWDAVIAYRTAAMLSGLKTQMINLFGNLSTSVYMPVERAVGGVAMGGPLTRAGREELRGATDELYATLASAPYAARKALVAAWQNEGILEPSAFANSEDFLQQWLKGGIRFNVQKAMRQPGAAVIDMAGGIVSIPFRGLTLGDELFKQTVYRRSVFRKAARELRGRITAGEQFTRTQRGEFIQRRLDEAYNGDGSFRDPEALREAQEATFQQALTHPKLKHRYSRGMSNSERLSQLRHLPMGKIFIPFFKTISNIFDFAHFRTPGLNMVSTEYRAALNGELGKEAQRRAFAQMSTGFALYGGATSLAMQNDSENPDDPIDWEMGKWITGSGPADPGVRYQLQELGWQPYSLRFTDPMTGERTWVDVRRIEPISTFFTFMADMVQLQQDMDEKTVEELGYSFIMSAAKMLENRPAIQGVSDFMAAATDPERNMKDFVASIAGSFVPNYLYQQHGENHIRDARSILDNIKKRIPGYRSDVDFIRNALGERVTRHPAGTDYMRSMLPAQPSPERPDEVNEELARVAMSRGTPFSQMPKEWKEGIDLTEVRDPMTGRSAWDTAQEVMATEAPEKLEVRLTVPSRNKAGNFRRRDVTFRGMTLRQALRAYIRTDAYQALPEPKRGTRQGQGDGDAVRAAAIQSVVNAYRTWAREETARRIPELQDQLRANGVSLRR